MVRGNQYCGSEIISEAKTQKDLAPEEVKEFNIVSMTDTLLPLKKGRETRCV